MNVRVTFFLSSYFLPSSVELVKKEEMRRLEEVED